VAGTDGVQRALPLELVIELRGLFANLVWAYLIGDVGMASILQIAGDMRIEAMWSLKSGKNQGREQTLRLPKIP
jgi:hypothetical protein